MESKMSGNQDIMYLLKVLEDEIETGKKAMFGGRVIDANKCLAIINDIRFNLPHAMSHASAIVKERESIIRDAKERAQRIVSDSEDKASTLLDNSEIVAKATEEADYIVAKAKRYADLLVDETLDSVDEMLSNSEKGMLDILSAIRDSRADIDAMYRDSHTTSAQDTPGGRADDSFAEDMDSDTEDIIFTDAD